MSGETYSEGQNIVKKDMMRDSHLDIILNGDEGNPGTAFNLNDPVWFPDPSDPNAVLDHDFWLTQIWVNGDQNLFWQLECNIGLTGSPLKNYYRIIKSGYIAKIGQSIPITVNIFCQKGSRIKFTPNAALGGKEAAGLWVPQLVGYYQTIRGKKEYQK